jgi:hypothetical protein
MVFTVVSFVVRAAIVNRIHFELLMTPLYKQGKLEMQHVSVIYFLMILLVL